MPNKCNYADFEDELSKLGFKTSDHSELIVATLKAMAKTAATAILSDEYAQNMAIDQSMQIDMVDEALGDYDNMMLEVASKVEKANCEKDSEPTEA